MNNDRYLFSQHPDRAWNNLIKTEALLNKALMPFGLRKTKLEDVIQQLGDNIINNEAALIKYCRWNPNDYTLENISARVKQLCPNDEKIQDQLNKIRLMAYEQSIIEHGDRILCMEIADRTAKDPNYATRLLEKAILYRSYNLIQLLLEMKTDVNVADNNGNTPLCHALDKKFPLDIIQLILEHGADLKVFAQDGHTPLGIALYDGNEEAVNALLQAGADPNLTNKWKHTPLLIVMERIQQLPMEKEHFMNLFKILVEAKADVNLVDNMGFTPLHHAAEKNLPACIKILVENGAHLETPNRDNVKPLELAIVLKNKLAISALKDLGADARYARNILKLQFLAHVWGIEGKFLIPGEKIHEERSLEGMFNFRAAPRLHYYLSNFFKVIGDSEPVFNPQNKNFILTAFKNVHPTTFQNALPKIIVANRAGQPCLILGGCKGHTIAITVTNNLLSVSNRGLGREQQREATDVFEMPKHMQTWQLFEKLIKIYDNVDDFYQMLNSLQLKNVWGISHKNQKIGNCTVANSKAAIMFLFVMITNGDLDEARRLYKLFTSYLRERTLQSNERSKPALLIKQVHEKQIEKASRKRKKQDTPLPKKKVKIDHPLPKPNNVNLKERNRE